MTTPASHLLPILKGRKIVNVFAVSLKEAEESFGWNARDAEMSVMLELDNGKIVALFSDPEGNRPGFLEVVGQVTRSIPCKAGKPLFCVLPLCYVLSQSYPPKDPFNKRKAEEFKKAMTNLVFRSSDGRQKYFQATVVFSRTRNEITLRWKFGDWSDEDCVLAKEAAREEIKKFILPSASVKFEGEA